MKYRFASFLLAVFFGLTLASCAASESIFATRTAIPFVTTSPLVKASPTPVQKTPTPLSTLPQAAYADQLATAEEKLRVTWTPTANEIAPAQTLTVLAYPATPTVSPTATFDSRSIQTAAPAPAAVCPQMSAPKLAPTLEYNGQLRLGVPDSVYLDYLNQFGRDALFQADLSALDSFNRPDSHIIFYRDLTNDGVPEIIVSFGSLYIFGCQNGKYQTLLATEISVRNIIQKIVAVTDLNRNGVPEIMVHLETLTQDDDYYRVYEWGNGQFNSLLDDKGADYMQVLSGGSFRFEDVDGDGLQEIIQYNGIYLIADYNGSAPYRRSTYSYKWNGAKFHVYKSVFDPPQYRFQAVEDADYAVLAQNYDQALALYQRVIFDDKLDWWTEERKEFIGQEMIARYNSRPFRITPPAPDPNEYLSLSAYAQFRIMVLHLIRGYESDAQLVYQTLIEKHPEGTAGTIYARMAQAFWNNYQITQSIGQACGKAREVAIQDEEEATRYLMDDYVYRGYPKQAYTIGQLCPFR